MKNRHRFLIAKLLFAPIVLFLNSCNRYSPNQELVMAEGITIEANNKMGKIRIEAGKGYERKYSWSDKEISVNLIPRSERWYGSLGIYSPGGRGKIHTVLEEGQQHFCSEEEAVEWLHWQNERMNWVYTQDGLVVGWYETDMPDPSMSALSVKVWQFYINGVKPRNLKGAQDSLAKFSIKDGCQVELPKVGNFIPNKPKEMYGRIYSGKSLDYIYENNFEISDVERTITSKKMVSEDKGIKTYWHDEEGKVFFIVETDITGRVVLVLR